MVETYNIDINHEELRREVDNYLNHAKANGIKINESYSAGLQGYVALVELVMRIEFEKRYTRKVVDDE